MAERDLAALLASLEPVRHDGTFVFCSVRSVPVDCGAAAMLVLAALSKDRHRTVADGDA